MKILNSFQQIEAELAVAEKQQQISDDAFRQSLLGWVLSPTILGDVPDNPTSEAFKAFQLVLYERLACRPYDVLNEETTFDFEQELRRPFPYSTQSAHSVGEHLMGYGWVIRTMGLPAQATILEIGSGYGALTTHLANMGYQVTCLDISTELLKFVKARTSHLPTPVKTIMGDMATVEIAGKFDAVIFNAAFHHSLEHRTVIKRLDSWLKPDGIAVFTAEPIVNDQSKVVPYPWGIRLDGLSIWSIYKWGWMELGFQESYFVKLMTDAGWYLKRYNLGISGLTDVWIATQKPQSSTYPHTSEHGYDSDIETELLRLKQLVESYEQGRFIRFMKWLKGH